MGIIDRLQNLNLKIAEGFDSLLGRSTTSKTGGISEEILHRLKSEIAAEKGGKLFPYRRINVRLQPPTKRIARIFRHDLIDNSSLKNDITAVLRSNDAVSLPEGLEISLEIIENISLSNAKSGKSLSFFELEFLEPVHQDTGLQIPKLQLEILKGNAAQQIYQITKDRLLIGCLPEVQDKEGRLVRKNDIVFPHEGNELNATVSTMHARIWFDQEMREFRIMDESSRYGTRLIRAEHIIEVPAENLHGVGLCNGDEVYFGRACLRFELILNTEYN